MTVAEKAKQLALAGYAVFPVKPDKTPYGSDDWKDGLKRATLDPFWAEEWFEKYPKALIGVHCGMSGIVVLDIDYKEGGVDGYDALDAAWLDIPDSFSYTSLSGLGKHILYRAPEGADFNGTGRYRGMLGVDRRAGESYIVFVSDEIPDKSTLALAPEWLCDPATVRSAEQFEGTVKDWYESLEPGEPNLLVRNALERIEKKYEAAGNDFDHAALIHAQFEAIRLGAEGNPGVETLLARIEEMFYDREGDHSRPFEEWAHEFQEGLASGIEKHGAAIDLRKNLPAFDLGTVPAGVPDRLLTGTPGDKETFRELLRSLQENTDDDLYVTSALWNSARTRDISREWGMEFVHQRVIDARKKPEPVRENPTLVTPEPIKDNGPSVNANTDTPESHPKSFLTAAERGRVSGIRTFIDEYLKGTRTKGFTNEIYAVPAAWTCLSMAFGRKAFIPLSKPLEVNLWLNVLGESTTGKGTEDRFLRGVLNAMFLDGEAENYNLGALSSADGLHIGLISRDNEPSIIHNDEASDFFRDIKIKDWMAAVPDKLAKWYDGFVEPSSKISLKDARGKSAHTSLNQLMWGTPERLLSLLDATQFDSGYLARVNWVWDKTVPDPDKKSDLKIQPGRRSETPDAVYDIAADLCDSRTSITDRVSVSATESAQARLNKAADDFRKAARKSPRYSFTKPAVDRLVMETLWKCAALLALHEGRDTFTKDDALVAISYASDWLWTVLDVSESISESPYSRDLEEMETFIRDQGGSVTRALLLHNFRGKVIRSQREIDDRIGYLIESGRVNRKSEDRTGITYTLNGS